MSSVAFELRDKLEVWRRRVEITIAYYRNGRAQVVLSITWCRKSLPIYRSRRSSSTLSFLTDHRACHATLSFPVFFKRSSLVRVQYVHILGSYRTQWNVPESRSTQVLTIVWPVQAVSPVYFRCGHSRTLQSPHYRKHWEAAYVPGGPAFMDKRIAQLTLN